jgi:penicillin G amidase
MGLGRNVEVEAERGHPVLRVLVILALLLVLAVAGAVVTGGVWLRHKMQSSLPVLDGRELVPGLTAPVMVRRDQHGVPHIQAANMDDLLFAQGYVTAQDRLWEMDMARRMAAGDAAEILGSKLVEHDRMQRILALRPTAERLVSTLDPQNRRYLEDYAHGVNAFIASHGDRLPAEFRLLMYRPGPWLPEDSMVIVLSMVQTLDEHWPEKLARERLTARLGPTLAADLYPTGSWRDHPPITTAPPITAPNQTMPDVPLDESQTGELRDDLLHVEQLTEHDSGACTTCVAGSNEWVVAGSRTASGRAMLSNDMHLEHQIPNIWYENGLEAPGFHVTGVTVPGMPYVVAGHNEHVAWGFTALYGDNQDIYVERTNGQDEYQAPDGSWRPVEHAQETIHVRGGHDVTIDVARTGHGVVISPLIPGETRMLALEWSIYDPKASGFPLLAMDQASNWTEFRAAASQWWAPTLNVVYADDQGHIGYQAVGYIPNRPGGLAGVPIADNQHEWQGYIPFDQMPSAYDPPDGILATANARVTPDGYPTPLTLEWAEPYRNERIWKWLAPKQKLTQQDMLTLQTDVYSEVHQEIAQRLAYAIDHASHANAQLRQAADLLRTWNGVVGVDSPAPAIVDSLRIFQAILRPKLGDDARLYRWAESNYAAEQIIMKEPAAWLPPHYSTWDDFLADLVRQGLAQSHAPADLSTWRYGQGHVVDLEHPLYGLLPWFKDWTGTGPQPQSGDTTTVKQVGRTFGPSQRFTIDWGSVDGATENIVMGESGDPLSPYYRDQWPYWYGGETFALPFSDEAVTAATAHTLRLEP